jgi:hypothetical protein
LGFATTAATQQVLRCNSTLTALDVSENHIPESLSLEVRRRRTARRFVRRTTFSMARALLARPPPRPARCVSRRRRLLLADGGARCAASDAKRAEHPRQYAKRRRFDAASQQAEAIAVRETTRSLSRRE